MVTSQNTTTRIMINWTETQDIRWVPPIREADNGWLIVNGEQMVITNWHHFNDFGQTIETVQARCGTTGEVEQFYSLDEGLNWSTEL